MTRDVRVLTALFSSLLIVIMLIIGVNVLVNGLNPVPLVILALVNTVLILLTYAYTPITVELRDSCLVIRRALAKPVIVDYDSIDEVIYVGKVRNLVRVFGVGGLFGAYGRFSATVLGKTMDVYLYSRGSKDCVLIRARGKNILIAVENPLEFAEALNRAIIAYRKPRR